MEELKINLENCYGIKKLDCTFDFNKENEEKRKKQAYIIYAPNGVMKTSLSKTIKDSCQGKELKDRIFPKRKSLCQITKDGNAIDKQGVFVVDSYNAGYQSDKLSTLLISQSLKDEYNEIMGDIQPKMDKLMDGFVKLSGIKDKKEIENLLESIFKKDIFSILIQRKKDIQSAIRYKIDQIKYTEIYNDSTLKIINSQEFRNRQPYFSTTYLQELNKTFQFTDYEKLKQFLYFDFKSYYDDMYTWNYLFGNFFYIKDKEEDKHEKIDIYKLIGRQQGTAGNLFAASQQVKDILTVIDEKDPFYSLIKYFPYILPELGKEHLENFKKTLWMAYFINQKDLIKDILNLYDGKKDEIEQLKARVESEQTAWQKTVEIFHSRFYNLPFGLIIGNKYNVMLKDHIPSIQFQYKDLEDRQAYTDQRDLSDIISSGEKRALYMLNIIFEIESRKKSDTETLIIFDDIADSFDYKNKYAIIEYLDEITETPKLYSIVLTHNFDFLRTLVSRGIVAYEQCLFASRDLDGVRLQNMEYIKNPFVSWKSGWQDDKKFIASIPFVRNILEYTKGSDNDDYKKLTSLLHYRPDTEKVTLEKTEEIFKRCISNKKKIDSESDGCAYNFIISTADQCIADKSNGFKLENKIVVSIAARLLAEKFMVTKIKDNDYWHGIQSNQYFELCKKYKEKFPSDEKGNNLLARIGLLVSDNIHLNAFMYEPIIDMGYDGLKDVYRQIKMTHRR